MSAINLRGATPLARLIKQYGGWSLTGGGMNSWSIEEKMGHVLRDLNVQTLLSVSVRPNLWDSTRNTLAVRLRRYFSFFVLLSDEIYFEKTSGICQASEFLSYVNFVSFSEGANAPNVSFDVLTAKI